MHPSAQHWKPPGALSRKLRVFWHRDLRPGRPAPPDKSTCRPLDIVIPTAPKDGFLLPLAIASLRKNLLNPIASLHVVAPDNRELRETTACAGATFIDERELVPERRRVIATIDGEEVDRTNNVYQQILKWSCFPLARGAELMVWDSDTMLLVKTSYADSRGIALAANDYWYPDYLRNAYLLTGQKPVSPLSFVMHHMVFAKEHLTKVKETIEHQHGVPWQEALYLNLNLDTFLNVSEYQTYAQFCLRRFPEEYYPRWERNIPLTGTQSISLPEIETRGSTFHTASLHHHSRIA